MRPDLPPLPWRNVVIVDEHRRSGVEPIEAMRRLGLAAQSIQNADELANLRLERAQTVVLQLGEPSMARSHLTQAPRIAADLGMAFVGLEAMPLSDAQNPMVAFDLAERHGLLTPRRWIMSNVREIATLTDVDPPYRILSLSPDASRSDKHGHEARSLPDGAKLVGDVFKRFPTPTMIIEMNAGRLATYMAMAVGPTTHSCMLEHLPATSGTRRSQRIDAELVDADRDAISRLLGSLGHYGFMRIDGQMIDGRFNIMRLVPVISLAQHSPLVAGYTAAGWRFDDIVHAVLSTAIKPVAFDEVHPRAADSSLLDTKCR